MPRSVIALRALWIVLMAVLLALVLTNSIAGYGMALYSVVVLAVMFLETAVRARAGRRAAR